MAKLAVGQNVRFNPFADHHDGENVNGKVIFVHPDHRYFTAEYEIDKIPFKTSFNFNDVYGQKKSVFIV